MQPGTKISHTEGKFTNYGVVELVDGERRNDKFYYIRWHKGFASWCSAGQLRVEPT